MKKLFTLFLSLFSIALWAQDCPNCMPNLADNLPSDTIYLEALPDATVGEYYEQSISFRLPKTTDAVAVIDPTVVPGVTIDAITIENLSNLPAGLTWISNQTVYDLPDESDGCLTICGTPIVPDSFFINVSLSAQVSILTQSANLTLPMRVLPASSVTDGFSLVNNTACGSVEVHIENNVPSNGQEGFSYLWDFGNGLTSDLENPPSISFEEVGTHYISYEAIIDTVGFLLTNVSVETASCDDVAVPFITDGSPELFIRVFDASGEQLFKSSNQDDTPPPLTFDLNIKLQEGNYTLEIWDEDGGIDGMDDLCGTINFNIESEGLLTNGEVSANLNIIHPVTTITSLDSVVVYPIPAEPILVVNGLENACQGDVLSININNFEDNIQWFQNGDFLTSGAELETSEAGAYWAVYSNEFACFNQSEIIVFEPSSVPNNPAYVNENNVLSLFESIVLPEFYTLQWYLDDELLEGETNPSLCAQTTGEYALELTDLTTACSTIFSSNIVWNASFDCTVGIELIDDTTFSVYPNPFLNYLNVEGRDELKQIKIWNALGQLIQQTSVQNSTFVQIDLSDLELGLYILELETSEGFLVKKIIKE